MSLPKGAYQALENALGPDNVCDDPGVTCAYSYMWLLYSTHVQSGRYRPAAVALPRNTEESPMSWASRDLSRRSAACHGVARSAKPEARSRKRRQTINRR